MMLAEWREKLSSMGTATATPAIPATVAKDGTGRSSKSSNNSSSKVQEIKSARLTLLLSIGLATDEATTMETRLLERDHDLDDRHCCSECLRFKYPNHCRAGLKPLHGMFDTWASCLHRCPQFMGVLPDISEEKQT